MTLPIYLRRRALAAVCLAVALGCTDSTAPGSVSVGVDDARHTILATNNTARPVMYSVMSSSFLASTSRVNCTPELCPALPVLAAGAHIEIPLNTVAGYDATHRVEYMLWWSQTEGWFPRNGTTSFEAGPAPMAH